MPMITLHNILIIWKIQHSSTQYTLMKWMHHYLLQIPPHHVIIIFVLVCQIRTTFRKIKLIPYNQGEFIPKANINTEMFLAMFLAILTSNRTSMLLLLGSDRCNGIILVLLRK